MGTWSVRQTVTWLLGIALALAPPANGGASLLDLGYRHLYNLEFDEAHRCFEQWTQEHPEDPMGPASNGAAYLFAEFDRLHILQSEFFVNDDQFVERRKMAPDPVLESKFESALSQSQKLADQALARAPDDRNAEFAAILRCGLHADYLAMVKQSYLASLREVKTGRLLAEKLLASDPSYYDAYLAIGVENYLLSLKPLPLRWLLRVGGAETDKDKGIARLKLTAEKGKYLQPYARLLLAVAALRDKDRNRAEQLLQGLTTEFPRNPLYKEELDRLRNLRH